MHSCDNPDCMGHDAVPCELEGFPAFLCGDGADYEVTVYAETTEGNAIEEKWPMCSDHARVRAANAIHEGFHVVANPIKPIRFDWADPDD